MPAKRSGAVKVLPIRKASNEGRGLRCPALQSIPQCPLSAEASRRVTRGPKPLFSSLRPGVLSQGPKKPFGIEVRSLNSANFRILEVLSEGLSLAWPRYSATR